MSTSPFALCLTIAALLAAPVASAATPAAQPGTPVPLVVIDTETIVAQARDAARAAREHARDITEHLRDMDLDLATTAFVQRELGGRTEIVKNAPYSAEAVSESVQVLGDGNRIVRETRTSIARDSLGRTRQEKKSPGGKSMVYVFDPIEDTSFAMNTERRTAVRIPRVPSPPIPPLPPMPSMPALPPVPPMPPVPGVAPVPPVPGVPAVPHVSGVAPRTPRAVAIEPGAVVVRRGQEGEDGDRDVRVQVLRIGGGEGPTLGSPTMLTLPMLPRGKGETRSLGARDFGGVKAEGTQTTHTIPAGEIGNEKPIVITSERWFSPELHVVVFARTRDPRVGETSYRLANLKRDEPSADLFKVPADYKSRR